METARVVTGAGMTMDIYGWDDYGYIWFPQVVFFGNGQSSAAEEITGILGERNFHCHCPKIHLHTQLRRSLYIVFCLSL